MSAGRVPALLLVVSATLHAQVILRGRALHDAAADASTITVATAWQSFTTHADARGGWSVALPPFADAVVTVGAAAHLPARIVLPACGAGVYDVGELVLARSPVRWSCRVPGGTRVAVYALPDDGICDRRQQLASTAGGGDGRAVIDSVGGPCIVAFSGDAGSAVHLVDGGGRPLDGTVVALAPDAVAWVTVPAAGAYRFVGHSVAPVLVPGTGELVRLPWAAPANVVADPAAAGVPGGAAAGGAPGTFLAVRIPGGRIAEGRVIGALGSAPVRLLPGAVTRIDTWCAAEVIGAAPVDDLGAVLAARVWHDGVTNEAGAFSVHAGRHELIVDGAPAAGATVVTVGTGAGQAASRPVRLDRLARLGGTVTGELPPAAALEVRARRDGDLHARVVGNLAIVDGTFGPFTLPPGDWLVWAAADGVAVSKAVAVTLAAGAQREVALLAEPAPMTGLTLRLSSERLRGARVTFVPGAATGTELRLWALPAVWRAGGAAGRLAAAGTRVAITDDEGHCGWASLAAAPGTLIIDAAGHAPVVVAGWTPAAAGVVVDVDAAVDESGVVTGFLTPPLRPDAPECAVLIRPWPAARALWFADATRILPGWAISAGTPLAVSVPGAPDQLLAVGARGAIRRPVERTPASAGQTPRMCALAVTASGAPAIGTPVWTVVLPQDLTVGGPALAGVVTIGGDPWQLPAAALHRRILRVVGPETPWTTVGPLDASTAAGAVVSIGPAVRVRGRVWDVDQRPAGDAVVTVVPDRDAVAAGIALPPIAGWTAADGSLVVPELPPGRSRLMITTADGAVDLDVDAGGDALGDLALIATPVRLPVPVGRWCEDCDGRRVSPGVAAVLWRFGSRFTHTGYEADADVPILVERQTMGPMLEGARPDPFLVQQAPPGAVVTLVPSRGAGVDPLRPVLRSLADAAGDARFAHVADGNWTVHLAEGGRSLGSSVTLGGTGSRTLTAAMTASAVVRFNLRDPSGQRPVDAPQVTVLDVDLNPGRMGSATTALAVWRDVDAHQASGLWEVSVPPGRRVALDIWGASPPVRARVDVPAVDGAYRVPDDVVLEVAGQVDVHVEAGQRPVAGATLVLLRADGSPVGDVASTDTDGRATFAAVPPGRLTLVGTGPLAGAWSREIQGPDGEGVRVVEVETSRGPPVTLWVATAAGGAAPGVEASFADRPAPASPRALLGRFIPAAAPAAVSGWDGRLVLDPPGARTSLIVIAAPAAPPLPLAGPPHRRVILPP